MSISFGPEFHSRYLAVDTTVTIILDTISIMVPYPTKNNDAASLYYVFDFWVWTCGLRENLMANLLLNVSIDLDPNCFKYCGRDNYTLDNPPIATKRRTQCRSDHYFDFGHVFCPRY